MTKWLTHLVKFFVVYSEHDLMQLAMCASMAMPVFKLMQQFFPYHVGDSVLMDHGYQYGGKNDMPSNILGPGKNRFS